MITGGDLRQSRLDVGYKTFTISPWSARPIEHTIKGKAQVYKWQRFNVHIERVKTIDDPVLESAKQYLQNISERHEQLSHENKSLIHSYLSVKNKFVGSKIGEAARFGAWNWSANVLEPFKRILETA